MAIGPLPSGRSLTPEQAAAALEGFDRQKDRVVLSSLNQGARLAQVYAVTLFMTPLGRGRNARPANPAPGPLGIRTGNLRRTVRPVPAEKTGNGFVVSLEAGGNGVDYARIQEEGGQTKPHVILPVNAKMLAFPGMGPGKLGSKGKFGVPMLFAREVHHPGSKIPARPYMKPALEKAAPDIVRICEFNLSALASQVKVA